MPKCHTVAIVKDNHTTGLCFSYRSTVAQYYSVPIYCSIKKLLQVHLCSHSVSKTVVQMAELVATNMEAPGLSPRPGSNEIVLQYIRS